jgi:hypothetical protein
MIKLFTIFDGHIINIISEFLSQKKVTFTNNYHNTSLFIDCDYNKIKILGYKSDYELILNNLEFWLNIKPFWETPEDHNNDEYVLKDAQYTFELFELFELIY